ncbi:copper chaperone PCu(A)C [Sphingomonas sp. MA1305]|uniref:copper chaperone PCu(A)C n=1 Tax=Sphingomonas sp. MA1305 TaxID=2479204 RepID=UPI0018DF31DD|nr:copper chaperone PCu(A)C [Sphingomonas sp. MA1305]
MRRQMAGVLAVTMAASLAGCVKPDPLSMTNAWVRLPAVPGRPAAGYFTLHGGKTPQTVIAANSDVSLRAEMHESAAGAGGTATMRPLTSVALPANSDVAFAPGGRHVMLFDVNRAVKPGDRVTLTATLANGARISARATVIAPGAPAPQF